MKYFHDSPQWEEVKARFGDIDLNDEDFLVELSYEAIGWIFKETTIDFNEDYETDIWIFFDPVIDDFTRLCQEYEEQSGLEEEHDPYRQQGIRTICDSFGAISGYGFDFSWRLSAKDHGRKRILFFSGPEFWDLTALAVALMEIRTSLEDLNRRLEQELKVIPLPAQTEWKEAA